MTTYSLQPQLVASEINESDDSSLGMWYKGTGKSLYTILELSTTNTKQSPVLDTQRMSAFTISNRLNSPTSSNTLVLLLIQQHRIKFELLCIVLKQFN